MSAFRHSGAKLAETVNHSPDANGWMPIETAPKDGMSVLIAWPDCNNRQHVDTAWNSGAGWYPYDRPATHWQPLPKPPQNPLPLSKHQQETAS